MESAKGYSLWLIPPDKNYQIFEKIINGFSKEYHTPKFIPHITLLGDIDQEGKLSKRILIKKSKEIAKNIGEPLEITLKDVMGETDKWWKRVYIDVNVTKKLLEIYNIANNKFNMKIGIYRPHLSLLYSNSLEINKTQKLIRELKNEFDGMNFRTSRIGLVDTNGKVGNWKLIYSNS